METWKSIKGYEGMYQVSNFGRVKSLARYRKNHSKLQLVQAKLKTPSVKNNGYLFTQLYKSNKGKNKYIHRLVAEAFLDNYSEELQVNHKDMDKENNHIDNLEMVTNAANHLHAHKFKKRKRGASKSGNKWRATITIDDKFYHLGTFKTKDEAYEAYYENYLTLYGIAPW